MFEAFPMTLAVQNSSTVALTLTGTGTEADPSTVSAEMVGSATASGKWGRWSGTQAEYDALGTYSDLVFYLVVAG